MVSQAMIVGMDKIYQNTDDEKQNPGPLFVPLDLEPLF
jgi:hypothetical protein